MTEENQEGVIDEPVAEAQETLDQGQEPESQQPRESDKDKNMREMREALREMQRENKHLRQEFEKSKTPPPSQDERLPIRDDDLVEGKTLKMSQREVQDQIARLEEKYAYDKLKSQFPDFDDVVSPENIEEFKKLEPELASTLAANTNTYSKAVAAYKLIKSSGIAESEQTQQQRERVQKNTSKPGSVQAVSKDSAFSSQNQFANGLTKELQKSLYKEMCESIKRRA